MPETIGQILRANREIRNLTLEQVAKGTHIRVRFLEALENDQREFLPSSVQGKGFLRLYLDFLQIPAGPMLDLWDGISPEIPEEKPGPPASETDQDNSLDPSSLPEDIFEERPDPVLPALPVEIHLENLDIKESGKIFREIGEKLRLQRISLGLTLAEIEKHTRVRLTSLELLEQGKMEQLPSLVQARGMLNNYAHFMNLDVDAVLLRFADALQARLLEHNSLAHLNKGKPKMLPKPSTGWRSLITPDLMVGTIVIFILITFGVWSAAQVTSFRGKNNISTIESISEILLETQNSNLLPVSGTSNPSTPTLSNKQGTSSAPGGSDDLPQITGTLPVIGSSPLQVYIVSHQRVWMRITADKKVVFDGRTLPGNAYPFAGDDSVELLTGDAGAIEVYFNQNNLGSLGTSGQVVSLIFTSKGIVTPTPMFTATPTNTLAPTTTKLPSPTVTVTPSVTPLIP